MPIANFANLLLRQAAGSTPFQPRLPDGSRRRASSALGIERLAKAHVQFEQAARIGKDYGRTSASIEIGISRLYALLADILGALQPEHAENPYAMLRAAATKAAGEYAHQAAAALVAPGSDPRSAGVAAEMLGHLAFRAQDDSGFSKYAEQARAAYLTAGSLVGLESVYRLLGTHDLRIFGLRVRRGVDSRVRGAAAKSSSRTCCRKRCAAVSVID